MPTALFLRCPGPGALFAFVERHANMSLRPLTLVLSDAVPEHLRRALLVPAPVADALFSRLVDAFGPDLARLDWDESHWRWERGGEVGGGPAVVRRVRLLERLPGWPRAVSPWETWARQNGLPLERLTDPKVPTIDYASVAGLDQRSLLVENGPRLYRFTIDASV